MKKVMTVALVIGLCSLVLLGLVAFLGIQEKIDTQMEAQRQLLTQKFEEQHDSRERAFIDAVVARGVREDAAQKAEEERIAVQRKTTEALARLREEMARSVKQQEATEGQLKNLQSKADSLAGQLQASETAGAAVIGALQANVKALETQLKALRFPPLAEGEQPLLEVAFDSVGPIKAERGDKEHLSVILTWRELREKPSDALVAKIAAPYLATGTKLEKLLVLEGLKEKKDGGFEVAGNNEKVMLWNLAWSRAKGDKPVAVMTTQFYGDRVRVSFYGGRKDLTAENRSVIRTHLLALAADLGLPAGTASDWAEPGQGFTDLYLRR